MIKELRTKTDTELAEYIGKLKFQLLQIRFDVANGKIEDSYKCKEIRKTIAMAMTVLSERNVKISFTTFDTQLITKKDGKQQIKSISMQDIAGKELAANSSKKQDKKGQ